MKIKRYTADSMRAALAQVRAEQGADAVILSSRRGTEGIEVIAAVDYDEALFAATKRLRVQPTEESEPVAAPAPAAASAPAPLVARVPPPSTRTATIGEDAGFSLMQREMREMRRLLESNMAGMVGKTGAGGPGGKAGSGGLGGKTGAAGAGGSGGSAGKAGAGGAAGLRSSDERVGEPLKSQVFAELTAMDIAPDVATAIAAATPRRTALRSSANIPLALLIKHLQVGTDDTELHGGILALVGPTGAGKTTTIAKLAARWCLSHGSGDLALVSTDSYRIGAREQLMSYARMLDAPMYTANSGKELARLLSRLSAKKLVLIDTAGMGPRDVRLTEQLAALKVGAAKAKMLLTLPAQGEGHALEEIVRAFARVSPQACILTKIDEAASLGGVLSASIRNKLKIAYLCNGQRVPEDLHAAEPRRVWLARAASHIRRNAPLVRDEARLARTFGRVHAHG